MNRSHHLESNNIGSKVIDCTLDVGFAFAAGVLSQEMGSITSCRRAPTGLRQKRSRPELMMPCP